MIYLVIPEPFSASEGVALSKIAADFMRYEEATTVVCPAADDTWGYATARVLIIPSLNVLRHMRGWRYVPDFLRRSLLTRAFRPLLSRLRPGDVVWFINWWEMADPIQAGIRRSGAKFVYHIHNSHQDFASKGGFRSLNPDAIIFISEAMRQEVANEIPSTIPVYTIHNGCEASRFWPAETPPANEIPVVLFVGRLVSYKGVHVLLEAIKILNDRKVPVVCRIVGSAHAQARDSRPSAYVTSLHRNAPANVTFAGFRAATEVAEEFRASDMLCCPSTFAEPFGLVNIEAMGCGLPVVGSRIGGIPEIASDGGILLFETGNAVDCADKLQQLLLSKDLRLRLREEGLASFKRRFTADAAVAAYIKVAASLTPNGHVLTGS